MKSDPSPYIPYSIPDPAKYQIIEQINAQARKLIDSRVRDGGINRASSAPRCVLARWYTKEGYKPEPMRPRSLDVFAFGDMTESYLVTRIMGAVGPGLSYKSATFGSEEIGMFKVQNGTIQVTQYKQLEWNTKIVNGSQTIDVVSHPDGVLECWDGTYDLLEIKSSASRGFSQAQREGVGDYIKQAHVLMASEQAKAFKISRVRFFYMNKDTQDWDTFLFGFNRDLWQKVCDEFIIANGKEKPAKPYSPKVTKDGTVLPWQCGYCEMNKHCWPEARMEIVKGKPVYFV